MLCLTTHSARELVSVCPASRLGSTIVGVHIFRGVYKYKVPWSCNDISMRRPIERFRYSNRARAHGYVFYAHMFHVCKQIIMCFCRRINLPRSPQLPPGSLFVVAAVVALRTFFLDKLGTRLRLLACFSCLDSLARTMVNSPSTYRRTTAAAALERRKAAAKRAERLPMPTRRKVGLCKTLERPRSR